MRTLYFRFIEINQSAEDTHKKVDEEWQEFNAALGTDKAKEEHVDLIHALCNLYVLKYGYPSLKEEDLKNIEDVSARYSEYIVNEGGFSRLKETFITTPRDTTDGVCLHTFMKDPYRKGVICKKCMMYVESEGSVDE